MKTFPKTRIAAAVALGASIALTAGCGGGSSSTGDDDGASSIVSRGIITGFGSVYVNGKKFRTRDARIEVDDSRGAESELRIGMMVTVKGSTEDGKNWKASRVVYDNELKGPISNISVVDATTKIVTILGQAVEINANTTFDDDQGLDFDTLAVDQVLEVSGFVSAGGLVATHVEQQDDDDEIEIKGYIDNLTANSFDINGFPVSYDGSTELDDIDRLREGLYVEVEGRLNAAGTLLIAEEIEAEDDDFDDDADEFEIEGMISHYRASDMTFRIHGQRVDAIGAELFPATLVLADGLVVEVDGRIIDGILFADKVKQRGKKIEISAPLKSVGGDSVSFGFAGGDVTVRVNRQTELEDDTGNPVSRLADFSAGDFVELEAFEDGSGVINAREIERTSPDEIEIEAPVDDFDRSSRTVELFGIEFDLSAARFENANDAEISAASFFNALSVGRFIEIEDSDRNGVFEKAELED